MTSMKTKLPLLFAALLPILSLQAKESVKYYTDHTIYSYTETNDDTGVLETYITYDNNNKVESYDGAFDGHKLSFKWETELSMSTIDKKTFTWISDSKKYLPSTYSDPATNTVLSFRFASDKETYTYSGTINGSKASGTGTFKDSVFINKTIYDEFKQHVGTAKVVEKLTRELHQKYSD